MSDREDVEDELAGRQKKEKKDLRAKLLALKKAAKGGNKQKQKETNAQCEKMEKELEERHKKEVAERDELTTKKVDEITPASESSNEDVNEEGTSSSGFYRTTKISKKAAKKQAKKKAVDEKWKEAVKEDKEASKTSEKYFENEKIAQILAEKQLTMYEIDGDGDCMYNAVAHQLSMLGYETTGKKLRRFCAEYMKNNRTDFLPFIAEESSDGEECDWYRYLDGVKNTAECGGVWGGELELNAISRHFKRVIQVIKADGERNYGEEFALENNTPIRIVYLRNALHLGEHYNSTI